MSRVPDAALDRNDLATLCAQLLEIGEFVRVALLGDELLFDRRSRAFESVLGDQPIETGEMLARQEIDEVAW